MRTDSPKERLKNTTQKTKGTSASSINKTKKKEKRKVNEMYLWLEIHRPTKG